MLVEEPLGRHHESRSAVPALLRIVIDERRRHGMQFAALRDAFDGLDVLALGFDSQHGAAVDHLAVHNDGAGPASRTIADLFGAGVIEAVAQRVDERDAGLDVQVVWLAVDFERHRHRSWTGYVSSRRCMRRGFQKAASQRARADAHATYETAARESVPGLFGSVRIFLGTHSTPSFRVLRGWVLL